MTFWTVVTLIIVAGKVAFAVFFWRSEVDGEAHPIYRDRRTHGNDGTGLRSVSRPADVDRKSNAA